MADEMAKVLDRDGAFADGLRLTTSGSHRISAPHLAGHQRSTPDTHSRLCFHNSRQDIHVQFALQQASMVTAVADGAAGVLDSASALADVNTLTPCDSHRIRRDHTAAGRQSFKASGTFEALAFAMRAAGSMTTVCITADSCGGGDRAGFGH